MPDEIKAKIQLMGDLILVEEIPAGEVKSASGLVIAGSATMSDGFQQNRPTLVHVLAVGSGYYDDADPEKTIELNSSPGDIIQIGPASIKWLSFWGPIISQEGCRIGYATDGDVQQLWHEGDFDAIYDYLVSCK